MMRLIRLILQVILALILAAIGYVIYKAEFKMIYDLYGRWESIFVDWKATLYAFLWNALFGLFVTIYFLINKFIVERMKL